MNDPAIEIPIDAATAYEDFFVPALFHAMGATSHRRPTPAWTSGAGRRVRHGRGAPSALIQWVEDVLRRVEDAGHDEYDIRRWKESACPPACGLGKQHVHGGNGGVLGAR